MFREQEGIKLLHSRLIVMVSIVSSSLEITCATEFAEGVLWICLIN